VSITDVLEGRRTWHVETGDALNVLRDMPDGCVQTCVTSPPYWSLRDYGVDGQLGLEPTPEEYVQKLVEIFREVRRVLRPDGTCWCNLGDSYNGSGKGPAGVTSELGKVVEVQANGRPTRVDALKPKDLVGIPWAVAFALRADGWWLRSDIVWCLSGGTKVYAKTQKGVMPMTIKDMVRLDPSTVQLWNGEKWTQVLGWSETPRPDNPIAITLRSGERIGCTPAHRWPTQRGLLRADELQAGDVIQSTIIPKADQPESPGGLDDTDIGWFVGMYIAEGSKSRSKLQVAAHVKETRRAERLAKIARAYHGTCNTYHTGGKAMSINLTGKVLEGIIDTYVSGSSAKTKHLTTAAWQRSNGFLRALLQGYLEGDGHHEPHNNRWRLGFTRNYAWAEDLRTIAARLGIQLRINLSTANIGDKTYPAFRGEIRFDPSNHFNAKPDTEIVAIGRSRARKFWDIGVADGPHLFALASGVLTHNSKPNPLPESVTDRPTRAHEFIFLLAKSQRYYYDADAIREPWQTSMDRTDFRSSRYTNQPRGVSNSSHGDGSSVHVSTQRAKGRNKRDVWTVATQPFPGSHFAVFPDKLIEPCILAGASPKACPHCGAPWARVVERTELSERDDAGRTKSLAHQRMGKAAPPERGWQTTRETTSWQPTCTCEGNDGSGKSIVLDPFAGAGTTGLVATRKGRAFIGIELNPEYTDMSRRRIEDDCPLFNRVWEVGS